MNNTQMQVLFIDCQLMKTENRHCVMPGPDSMRSILRYRYQHDLQKSAYHAAVHWLEEHRFITRQFRWVKDCEIGARRKSSLVAFTLKGCLYLIQVGVSYGHKLLKQIKEWHANKDRRFPRRDDFVGAAAHLDFDFAYNMSKLRELQLSLAAYDDS